jgi:SAM-dependent methyltransferase
MTEQPLVSKNDFYAGFLYHVFFDPFTSHLRSLVAAVVPAGSSVLDVGCGTGYQLLRLAPHITTGVGVDLADRMIAFARKKQKKKGFDNLSFGLANAGDLSRYGDNEFDVSTLTLVLHEMATDLRLPAINEMARVSKRQIIADYTLSPGFLSLIPMYLMEISVGILHYHLFRSYMKNGAAPELFRQAGLRVVSQETAMLGMVRIWTCEKA